MAEHRQSKRLVHRSAQQAVLLRPRGISLFLFTSACVGCSLLFTRVLLFSIVGAIALAVVLYPLTLRLERRLSATLVATISVVLVTLALLLPSFLLLRELLTEVGSFSQVIQQGAAETTLRRIALLHPKVGGFVRHIGQHADLPGMASQLAGSAARVTSVLLSRVVSGVTGTMLLLFFFFFLVRDRHRAVAALGSLVPLGIADTNNLLHQTRDVVQAIFAGRLVIALIQGTLAGFAYLLLGVPAPLLWTAITIVCCLIPAFGSYVVWVPIAVYLGLTHGWTRALILTAWGSIVVGNIDNVLYPMLVGKRTDLHTAVIFVAIFGGLSIFGVSGLILGPVIVAVTTTLLDIWKRRTSKL